MAKLKKLGQDLPSHLKQLKNEQNILNYAFILNTEEIKESDFWEIGNKQGNPHKSTLGLGESFKMAAQKAWETSRAWQSLQVEEVELGDQECPDAWSFA